MTSFLELAPLLLQDEQFKFILTERFSQDALESYFGDQRSRGHRNDNPTVQQFCITANILRVSGGLSRKERGNIRGVTVNEPPTDTPGPLRKRSQKKK